MKLSGTIAILLVSIVAVFAAACGSSGTPTTGFTTYTDSINGFSVSVPDGWELQEDASGVSFLSPTTCADWYPFGAVTASYEESYTSAQTYYTDIIEPIIENFDGYNLISEDNLTIDGLPAVKVVCTYTGSYGESVQETFCVLINQQTAWLIIGSCDVTCWNTYQGTFNTMANSFQVWDVSNDSGGSGGSSESQKAAAYNSVSSQVETAVGAYAAMNSGAYPELTGIYSVSGCSNCHIIDIKVLLTSQGGMLSHVPDGTHLASGANNDNCDSGASGCSTNSHYVWLIDDYGNVYSKCIGADCNSNAADGYQGVWP